METLPDDLVLQCVKFVPSLSLGSVREVSKRFRKLVRSSELREVRSKMRGENLGNFLYVFSEKEDQNGSSSTVIVGVDCEESQVYLYGPVIQHLPFSTVALGDTIYFLGGKDHRSKEVFSYDVLHDKWSTDSKPPSMIRSRHAPPAFVSTEKIFVSSDLDAEVFDPATQSWELMDHFPTEILSKEV